MVRLVVQVGRQRVTLPFRDEGRGQLVVARDPALRRVLTAMTRPGQLTITSVSGQRVASTVISDGVARGLRNTLGPCLRAAPAARS